MALQIGDLLSQRYRVRQILAQSEAESLFLALDKISGKDVLVKAFTESMSRGGTVDAPRAEMLAGLRHPNLAPVSDHFTIPGQGTYVVFDTGGGKSLRQRLAEIGPLPYTDVVPLLLNLCDALFYLHDRQPLLVHGNIGLDAIFLLPDGKVFLLYSGELPIPGAESGIPADVFALGKTAFGLLTNRPVPKGHTLEQIKTHLQSDFPEIPTTIGTVIAQSIDPSLDHRFGSSEDFKVALLYALVQIPPETLRTPPVNLPVSETGFKPIAEPEPQDQPPPAAAPPAQTTPIRRRVPWGLL